MPGRLAALSPGVALQRGLLSLSHEGRIINPFKSPLPLPPGCWEGGRARSSPAGLPGSVLGVCLALRSQQAPRPPPTAERNEVKLLAAAVPPGLRAGMWERSSPGCSCCCYLQQDAWWGFPLRQIQPRCPGLASGDKEAGATGHPMGSPACNNCGGLSEGLQDLSPRESFCGNLGHPL